MFYVVKTNLITGISECIGKFNSKERADNHVNNKIKLNCSPDYCFGVMDEVAFNYCLGYQVGV